MSVVSCLKLELLRAKYGKWFDEGDRAIKEGRIYAFRAQDCMSGEWLLNVFVQNEGRKALVKAVASQRTTEIHAQLKRRTDVFVEGREPGKLYHPLGISFVVNGHVRWRRIRWEDLDQVPVEIRENFTLAKYEDVSRPGAGGPLVGKVVAVVGVDEPDKMALLFMLEKVRPAFRCSTP
ncbi:hypothetical protein DRO60_00310 [Candidatus Bathyarchaeota archaeon]|nr:MAG: hypothetical protein DRO60_00310 [Candidatus Bathyarchaeota archaeon]